jgi:hypothetical protein
MLRPGNQQDADWKIPAGREKAVRTQDSDVSASATFGLGPESQAGSLDLPPHTLRCTTQRAEGSATPSYTWSPESTPCEDSPSPWASTTPGSITDDSTQAGSPYTPSQIAPDPSPDMFVIGLQEAGSIPRWSKLLAAELEPRYTKVENVSLGGTHMVIYVRSEMRSRITNVQSSKMATGKFGVCHNKVS